MALCGLVLAGCSTLGLGQPSGELSAGPLGATWPQFGVGTYVDAGVDLTDVAAQGPENDSGSDIVLEYIRPAAKTLGVTWLGAYVFDEAVGGRHHRPGFPPDDAEMELVEVAGHQVAAGGEFGIAFGERVDGTALNGIQGLSIGYRIGDQHYEATLLYRSVLCAKPAGPPCDVDQPVPGLPDQPSDQARGTEADASPCRTSSRARSGHRAPSPSRSLARLPPRPTQLLGAVSLDPYWWSEGEV